MRSFSSLILAFFLGLTVTAQKQEPFVGKLVYSIVIADTSLQKIIPAKQMVVYTNDTLLRIENETDQLGKQVIIKHMQLNKSYLLLRTSFEKYAIQTDHNADSITKYPYSFKKKMGRKRIAGQKANRLMVSHENFQEPIEFLYLKKHNAKYLNTLENFPGLPVRYFISSVDGVYIYTLISIEYITPEKDLFGIPSDYKKVSFDQFLNEVLEYQQQQQEKMPEIHE